jgi:hypothetical protein
MIRSVILSWLLLLSVLSSAFGQTDSRFGRWLTILGGDPAWAEGVEIDRRIPGRITASNEHILIGAQEDSQLPTGIFIYPHKAALFDKTRRTDRPVLSSNEKIIEAGARSLTSLGFDMTQYSEVKLIGRESSDSAYQNGQIGLRFYKKVNGLDTTWDGISIDLDPVSGKVISMLETGLGPASYESIDGVMSEAAAIARAREIAREYYRNHGTLARKSDPEKPATAVLGYGLYGGELGSQVSSREARERTLKPPVYTICFGSTSVIVHAKTGENLGGGIFRGEASSGASSSRQLTPTSIPFTWTKKPVTGGTAPSKGSETSVAMVAGVVALGGLGVAAFAMRRRRGQP